MARIVLGGSGFSEWVWPEGLVGQDSVAQRRAGINVHQQTHDARSPTLLTSTTFTVQRPLAYDFAIYELYRASTDCADLLFAPAPASECC